MKNKGSPDNTEKLIHGGDFDEGDELISFSEDN